MKSWRTAFSLRSYINFGGVNNLRFLRNFKKYEKSVTPATLVDNQCVVVTLAGFSFHTSFLIVGVP